MKQLKSTELQQNIQVPPELKGAMERIVIAAKKLAYSEEMKPQFEEQFGPGNPDPMGEKLASAAFVIIGSLFGESNGTLPPQLLVPAGVFLITDLADFIEQSGMAEVEDKELGQAMEMYIGFLANSLDGVQAQPQQGKTQPGPPAMSTPAPAASPQPAGLISGQQQAINAGGLM